MMEQKVNLALAQRRLMSKSSASAGDAPAVVVGTEPKMRIALLHETSSMHTDRRRSSVGCIRWFRRRWIVHSKTRADIPHAQPDDPATDGLVYFPVCTLALFGAKMDRVARTAHFAGVLQTARAHGVRAYTELHSAQRTIGRFGRFIGACVTSIAPNLR